MRHIQVAIGVLRSQGFWALFRSIILWLRGIRRYSGSYTKAAYRAHLQYSESNLMQLASQKALAKTWQKCPYLTLITSVDDNSIQAFQETYLSLSGQSYDSWEWIIVTSLVDFERLTPVGAMIANDSRIKMFEGLSAPNNPVPLLNKGLQNISGDFFIFIEAGDTLAPFALFMVAEHLEKHPDIDILYSDMDLLDARGERHSPLFRPDWSPEMMLSNNILECLAACRSSLLSTVGLLNTDTPTCYRWEFGLRALLVQPQIDHLAHILYHRRETNMIPPDRDELEKILAEYLIAQGYKHPQVKITSDVYPQTVVRWETTAAPVISIIIPTRDQHCILGECLNSLFELTSYPNYEVIIVDTGSTEQETFALYRRYENTQRLRTISFVGAHFNFSAACNQGAQGCRGKLLLFLNNDTRIIQADWLNRLAQWFEDDGVGIVGPKLLYPGGTIQHAGVIVGLDGLAGHLFNGETEGQWTVFGSDRWYRNLQAVTGACLMISSDIFKQVNGFDERFKLNFSDVDLGLRVHAAGYRVIFTPDVRLIHHESITHKSKIPRSDFERANALWQHWIQKGDPYFNQNLSYRRGVPFLSLDDSDSSSAVNREMMRKLPQGAIISLPTPMKDPIDEKPSTNAHL